MSSEKIMTCTCTCACTVRTPLQPQFTAVGCTGKVVSLASRRAFARLRSSKRLKEIYWIYSGFIAFSSPNNAPASLSSAGNMEDNLKVT